TGSAFTACQPASMPSFFTGSAGAGDDFINFNLTMPAGGKFCSTWLYSPPFDQFPGGFVFDGGKFTATTVPEPGTLGLMSVGVAGVIGSILRKRKGLWKSAQ